MKIFFAIFMSILIIVGLSGCGKDYSKHQFDYLGDDFHWDMTVEDAVKFIENRQTVLQTGAEVTNYEIFTIVKDRTYVFSFDDKGKLEYIKVNMFGDRNKLRHFVDLYGEYDEYEGSINGYIWYGTIDGRNTVMSFSTYPNYDVWLEFKPA